jgi:hypothetical protein
MSTLIKIVRGSIKGNPNAGKTVTKYKGSASCTFQFKGAGRIPDDLLDKVSIQNWENADNPIFGVHQVGQLLNPDDFQLFTGIEGISLEFSKDIINIEHLPEPEYFFEYENTPVECENCHQLIQVDAIPQYVVVTEDDEYVVDQCPHCKKISSFNYIIETITEAIKDKE